MTAEREGLAEEVVALADVIFENSDEPMWSAVVIAKAQWDALADLLAARDRRVRAEALREAADDAEQFAEETYGEWLFRRPTTEDYAEINALLKRERGHQLDGVAGACYRHALTVRAEMLREKAAEIEADR